MKIISQLVSHISSTVGNAITTSHIADYLGTASNVISLKVVNKSVLRANLHDITLVQTDKLKAVFGVDGVIPLGTKDVHIIVVDAEKYI